MQPSYYGFFTQSKFWREYWYCVIKQDYKKFVKLNCFSVQCYFWEWVFDKMGNIYLQCKGYRSWWKVPPKNSINRHYKLCWNMKKNYAVLYFSLVRCKLKVYMRDVMLKNIKELKDSVLLCPFHQRTIMCIKIINGDVNLCNFFTCVAEGVSRSRSAVTPSVRLSVCPSVCMSVRPSQNLVIATPLKLLI